MRHAIVIVTLIATACSAVSDAPATTTIKAPSTTTAPTASTALSTTTTAETHATTTTSPASVHPVGRRGHAMVSLDDGRLLVVGGWTIIRNATTWLGDSWIYDTITGAWTETGSLPARGHFALAAHDGEAFAFGGYVGGSEVYADVRALRSGEWVTLDRQAVAARRAGAVAAYDESADLYVLVGGDDEPLDARIADGVTWTFDGSIWADITTANNPRHRTEGHPVLFELAMDYDLESELMILMIGGDETWVLDTRDGLWTERTPPDSAADFMIAAAYHAGLDRMVTYGGAPTGLTQETWAYDSETDTWELIPTLRTPGPIGDHAMAYDPATDSVYLFGGTPEPLGLGDPPIPSAEMWRFDGVDWTLVWEPET